MDTLKILLCSSEVTPFAKTGGLADVSAALPAQLNRQGLNCSVVMPLYREVRNMDLPLKPCTEVAVVTGAGISEARIFSYKTMYFISHPLFSDRTGLYSYAGQDYPDNLERFAFFSRACVELIRFLGDIQVVHCNDWQTALVLPYLKDAGLDHVASLFTIHNLAYQGIFDAILWSMLFLPHEFFHPDCMEFFGRINVMKAGIVFSDAVNTVSPTYAREIQTGEFGSGLDGLLRAVSHKLSGITNGIDDVIWDPATDPLIARNYSRHDMTGKQDCKRALLEEFSLPRDDGPVFGLISRLVEQKGIDCVLDAVPAMAGMGARIVVLGNGNPVFERRLKDLRQELPGHVGIHIGFDEAKAHAIEAGADFFLMPSRFEPCGLNQMISMRYGTIPIVTGVGGLRDTVRALGEGERPYGLRVASPNTPCLLDTVTQACRLSHDDPGLLLAMRLTAMEQDVSWDTPARQYAHIYRNCKILKERTR
ncbi:MAG TPA: glycogen synthase GlgA [Deltaproteobacteria bacterium]|nr:glycogen synthase GlgA [Deltaproteobacteria bacterium]HQI79928.1 glycogen synthase GlgA [Deltaproteobacteria bacterium]